MKKIMTAAIAAAILLSMSACGSKPANTNADTSSAVSSSESVSSQAEKKVVTTSTDSDTQSDTSSAESKSESKAESKAESKSESKAESKTESKAEVKAELKKEVKTESKAQTEVKTESTPPEAAQTTTIVTQTPAQEETTPSDNGGDACEQTPSDDNTDQNAEEPTDEPTDSGSFDENSDLVVNYNGQTIRLEDDIKTVIEKLGEDYELTSAPSCLYPGMEDKSYNYGDITVNTFPTQSGDGEYVSGVTFNTENVKTEKGAAIFMKMDEIFAMYGTNYTMLGGSTYRYVSSDGKYFLQFFAMDDAAAEITIAIDSNNI